MLNIKLKKGLVTFLLISTLFNSKNTIAYSQELPMTGNIELLTDLAVLSGTTLFGIGTVSLKNYIKRKIKEKH